MIDARIVFGKPEKFSLHALVRLRGFPRTFDAVSLRHVKTGKTGSPRRIFIKADRQHPIGARKHNSGARSCGRCTGLP